MTTRMTTRATIWTMMWPQGQRGALLALLAAVGARAQEAAKPARTIAIIGASASAGFSDQLRTATTPSAP